MASKRKTRAPTNAPAETPSRTETPITTIEIPTATIETPTATTEQQSLATLEQGAPQPGTKKEIKKPSGMMASLKELVFADPKLSVDDLIANLKEAGFSPSKASVQTIRADFLHSLRICHFAGVKGLTKFVRE